MLVSYLRDNWPAFAGGEAAGDLKIATICSCPHDYGNDLVLIFVDGSRSPDYVMKISRHQRFGFKLKREYAALSELAEVDHLRDSVPAACYLGEFGGRVFFIQRGIRGVSLSRLLLERGPSRKNRDLLFEAVDLLVRINRAGHMLEPDEEPPRSERLELDPGERRRLAASHDRLSGLAGSFYLQGDYWPNNMLVSRGRISGVVDWEFTAPSAPLPTDIIWFLINVSYLLSIRERPALSIDETYRRAFFTPTPLTRLLRQAADRYFTTMAIDRRLFLPLLEATLCAMAQRELDTYGAHGKVDAACLSMLRHTLAHEADLVVA